MSLRPDIREHFDTGVRNSRAVLASDRRGSEEITSVWNCADRRTGLPSPPVSDHTSKTCFGFCRDCGREHSLAEGDAREQARRLMAEFDRLRRLDYLAPASAADPDLGFDKLFPGARGHMFGVLECKNGNGESVVLRAFSSLHGGIRTVPGWAPPILPDDVFNTLVRPGQLEIKRLTRELKSLFPGSPAHAELLEERKQISRRLMPRVHDRYFLNNFRGERRALREAWNNPHGLPGGVGDCCAPKLLNHAAHCGLKPIGLVEFYWGGPHQSGNRIPGRFYPACAEKCQPILGFMLCGLDSD